MKYAYMKDRDLQIILHINNHYKELKEELEMIKDSFKNFEENMVVQKAIKMDLFQIGENVNILSKDFQSTLSVKDLKGIISIRNYIGHGYVQVDNEVIWDSIHVNLPVLIGQINFQFKNEN